MVICPTGDIVLLKIFNEEEMNVPMALKNIHKCFANPLNSDEKYLVHGVVAFYGGRINTRRTSENDAGESGHYTAIIYRRGNNTWMEYDDLKEKSAFVNQNKKIVVRLIMYVKDK